MVIYICYFFPLKDHSDISGPFIEQTHVWVGFFLLIKSARINKGLHILSINPSQPAPLPVFQPFSHGQKAGQVPPLRVSTLG